MRYAKEANYRVALIQYLADLKIKLTSNGVEENVRIGAERAFEMIDKDEMETFANTTCFDDPLLLEEMKRRIAIKLALS